MTTTLADRLLPWYTRHARPLPWRRSDPDPYAVWVSEIMAQQTRLETVIPYFERWMDQFPDIPTLARADQQEVLNAWEGLGYYSRARNLHKAAGIVVEKHQSRLPEDADALRALPGIGRYTAGAIASIAFGQDEAVVDGNVKRVYARLFRLDAAVNTPAGEKAVWSLAQEHLPPGRAADYNQALMDLGATVCLPRQPDCPACPLYEACAAFQSGQVEDYPLKKPKARIPHHTVTAAVLTDEQGCVLICQRPEDALLGGLWEFPGGKQEPGETLPDCLEREIFEELGCRIETGDQLGTFRHTYTHFAVTLHAFHARLTSGTVTLHEHQEAHWVRPSELDDFPMGKLDRMISQRLQGRQE